MCFFTVHCNIITEHKPPRLFIPIHVKRTILYHNCIHNPLPEDEPSGWKHVEDIKKIQIKTIILGNVHFVVL